MFLKRSFFEHCKFCHTVECRHCFSNSWICLWIWPKVMPWPGNSDLLMMGWNGYDSWLSSTGKVGKNGAIFVLNVVFSSRSTGGVALGFHYQAKALEQTTLETTDGSTFGIIFLLFSLFLSTWLSLFQTGQTHCRKVRRPRMVLRHHPWSLRHFWEEQVHFFFKKKGCPLLHFD